METLAIIACTVYKYIDVLSKFIGNGVLTEKEIIMQQANEALVPLNDAIVERPELLQIETETHAVSLSAEDINKIRQNAQERYVFPLLPTAESFVDVVELGTINDYETKYILTPKYLKPGNIVFKYKSKNKESAIKHLGALMLNMVLSIPVGKVNFTVIDFGFSKTAEQLASEFSAEILNLVRNEGDFIKALDTLQKKADALQRSVKNVLEYNVAKKTIRQPYEVVVFLDASSRYKEYQAKISALLSVGSKAGLYFIFLNPNNEEMQFNYDTSIDVEIHNERNCIINNVPYYFNANTRNLCLNYIRQELESVKEEKPVKMKIPSGGEYHALTDEISLSVGEDMLFRMNNVNHVHAFIVGQSGSGKSVFLHNIIGSVIHKYAPEDLQLYLMDFKLGGVEFNRYKGVKHVKAMLVDNSDQQITLEILRELRNSMVERGKLLRNAGVTNIEEYNLGRTLDKMAHILLVADECHEMFRVGDSIPRTISNEIAEIITKIAKEGRSQGVHLILATQTLSGAEISNEILHNISDHYLLKCAQTDSERLVPGSSDITSSQTTGEIYYHHVEEQMQFKAFYTPKEEAEKLVAAAVKKADGHQSNGEFYFSGAQLFYLNDCKMEENRRIRKNPVAFLGKSIDLNQKDIAVNLKEDFSENILVFGLNDDQKVTRTSYVLMLSTMLAIKKGGLDIPVKVINCQNDEESIYEDILEELSDAELCDVISRRERGSFLKQLAESVKSEKAEPMLLFIFGQERFRELKMDMEIGNNENASASDSDFSSLLGAFSSSADAGVQTFRQAIDIILEHGPEIGVHTIIQVDKPTNLLFEDMTAKEIFKKFKHLIMLKSDEMTASRLNLRDDIRLETLSKDPDRLRAYYYAEESDSYTLFTPYMLPDVNNILELINNA